MKSGPQAKARYHLLEERHKGDIDQVLSPLGELSWRLKPDVNKSMVMVQRHLQQEDPSTWLDLNRWLTDVLVAMHNLFRPIVKELDPSEWVAPDDEDGGTADGIDD